MPSLGSRVIFMKVGVHAQEPLEEIIERKRKELRDAGRIFWGYGGGTCHPLSHVQTFAHEAQESNDLVKLVMQKMDSHHRAEPALAREYSDDGVNWKDIPKGIYVKGSRYAMVLRSLEDADLELDLNQFRVAVGPSRGRSSAGYLRGRVDKGCFERVDPSQLTVPAEPQQKHIDLVGELAAPYAVLLR